MIVERHETDGHSLEHNRCGCGYCFTCKAYGSEGGMRP